MLRSAQNDNLHLFVLNKFRPDVEAVSGGGTKSVSAGAGLFTNPRIGARSSVRTSVAGEDSRKERFFRRFLPVQKAANIYLRMTGQMNNETIFRCPARAMRALPQPGNEEKANAV